MTTDTNTNTTDFNFREHLAPEYKEKYTEFKDVNSVFKSYDSLVTKMGSSISIPKEDAPKEEWEKFHQKLGRPESADKYEFQVPEYPNGIKPDENVLKGVKDILYQAGVPAKQAKQIAESYFNMEKGLVEKAIADNDKALKEAEASMKKEWGADYDSRLQSVNGFAERFADDNDKEAIKKYGNDPAFIKMMYNLSKKVGEDTNTNKGGDGASQSKEALAKRKSEILKMDSPYWKPNDPAHEAVKAELRKINQTLTA
jgi:hypothetical protein